MIYKFDVNKSVKHLKICLDNLGLTWALSPLILFVTINILGFLPTYVMFSVHNVF